MCLGRGGFGVVKRAIYKGKQVAVKFVEGAASDPKFYECFRKELEILS
jgi:serine/threonine protein kinase